MVVEYMYKDKNNFVRQLRTQLNRARENRGPATLTIIEDWQAILKHFQGKYAYCQYKYVEALDRFVPIKYGVGIKLNNCLPICIY